MNAAFTAYLVAWLLACLLALVLYLRDRSGYIISRRDYWRFLAAPWKLATFAIAATGMVVIAPYTGDPTWDYFDAGFMSLFCFATSPWAVGVMYRAMRRQSHWREIYVAACAWMFTVSWSYDLYMLIKTGMYPITWLSNIFLSSILYILAGMLWSLEYQTGRGVIFGFMRADWPNAAGSAAFGKIFWYTLPFMILVTILVAAFVIPFFM
jgi:hypothetical protein